MQTPCINYGSQLTGQFCSACGQKADIKRIELLALMKDLPSAVFHVNSGILFNLVQLCKRPGAAMRDYIAGKRKAFFHPVTYLVLSLVINYLAVKITNLHFYDAEELKHMTANEAKLIVEYDATRWWFLEHTYLYIVLSISVCSLFLYFFLKGLKQGFNLAESAVIVMFTISQGVVLQSILYFAFGWVESGVFIRAVEGVNTVFLLSYASYAVYSLLNTSTQKPGKVAMLLLSLFAGFTLLALMVGSAYVLYYLSHLSV